jgi:hypothetical protein
VQCKQSACGRGRGWGRCRGRVLRPFRPLRLDRLWRFDGLQRCDHRIGFDPRCPRHHEAGGAAGDRHGNRDRQKTLQGVSHREIAVGQRCVDRAGGLAARAEGGPRLGARWGRFKLDFKEGRARRPRRAAGETKSRTCHRDQHDRERRERSFQKDHAHCNQRWGAADGSAASAGSAAGFFRLGRMGFSGLGGGPIGCKSATTGFGDSLTVSDENTPPGTFTI